MLIFNCQFNSQLKCPIICYRFLKLGLSLDSTYTHFCQNIQGCLLVFDLTNKTSFEMLDAWVQEFFDNGGKGAIVAVVGNKVRCHLTNTSVQPLQQKGLACYIVHHLK